MSEASAVTLFEDLADVGAETPGVGGFREHSRERRAPHVGVIAESRDDDHGDTVRAGLYLPQEPAPVLTRHGVVRDHDVNIRYERQSGSGAGCGNDVRARLPQDVAQKLTTIVVVLDNEDPDAEERREEIGQAHRSPSSRVRPTRNGRGM
jgi:hypothetical protein